MPGALHITLAAICLGGIGIFVKLIGDAVPPAAICFYRALIGSGALFLICPRLDANAFRIPRADWKHLIAIGVLQALTMLLFVTANSLTTVSNAVILNAPFIFFTPPIAAVVLRERLTRGKVLAALLATAGIVWMNPFSTGNALGNWIALLSGAADGALIVYLRFVDRSRGIGEAMWYLFFSALALLPVFLWSGPGNLAAAWPWLLGIGIISTGLAYLFLNEGLERLESELSSLILYIVSPLAAIGLATTFLGEPLPPETLAGTAVLLLAGIAVLFEPALLAMHRRLSLFQRLAGLFRTPPPPIAPHLPPA